MPKCRKSIWVEMAQNLRPSTRTIWIFLSNRHMPGNWPHYWLSHDAGA
jgi:hypothetical protein